MPYSIFSWENIQNGLGWSNTRAWFVGSALERERAEMQALFDRVNSAFHQSRYADPDDAIDFVRDIVAAAAKRARVSPGTTLTGALHEMVWQLLVADPVLFFMPDRSDLDSMSIESGIELRTLLTLKERVLARPGHYEALWREHVGQLITALLTFLPTGEFDDAASNATAAFTVPLVDLCARSPQAVELCLLAMFDKELEHEGLFANTSTQLEHNLAGVMGMTRDRARQSGKPPLAPTASDKSPRDLVVGYLSGTPFLDLFATALPFALPESARFEHHWIVAGSGHGKTQTLQHLILSDLHAPSQPSLVIIDSQGDMIRKISHLALFDGDLANRLIIIDPRDVDHPPALNMFDVNMERLNRYGAADREQILNGIIELYEYFFGSLLGAELTQKQALIFRYLARLMIYIPSATIRTMIDLMDDTKPYQHIIATLPESTQMFFAKEFPDRSFSETKTQIKRRLYGIIENQTFERMFSAPRNRIDIPTALNEGKIVLVNTAKDFLKGGSSVLGRYFIALTLQAALERAAIPESQRYPAFLYIDEAAEYFDSNIDDLLNQARKYKLGMVMAHQYLDQLQGGLRASIASNTSIKFAGGVSDRDARSLAADMRTTPTFILEQHKGAAETQFACYLRNVTPNALSLTIPFGTMEQEPVMSDRAYQRLLEANRDRVSGADVDPEAEIETAADAEEPMIRLHHPDLPWKLEGTDPSDLPTEASPNW